MRIIVRVASVLLGGFLVAVSGCGTMHSRSFLNPDADFGFYERVGLLPFRNQTEDPLAGDKLTEHFLTEALRAGKLQVMDPGQFNAIVAQVMRSGAPPATLEFSPTQLAQVGQLAGVQGIFMGIVHDYKMIQIGGEQYPLISMTTKFVDVATGTVVWQSNATARGGPNLPLVSFGESFVLGELSQKICRKTVSEFHRKAGL